MSYTVLSINCIDCLDEEKCSKTSMLHFVTARFQNDKGTVQIEIRYGLV